MVTLAIGIYIIINTVLVTKDGDFYIGQARKIGDDLADVARNHPPGYPLLIFLVHRFVALFSNNPSVYLWIYSGQFAALLCRLASLIPLYFTGKFLVGPKNSFWAVFILIILPEPAHFGSDILREWPHILFLATALFFLLWGAKKSKWWMFAIVGLIASLGQIIRPECAQVLIYAFLWLIISLFRTKRTMSKAKILCALVVLLTAFVLPAIPYMIKSERCLPTKAHEVIHSLTARFSSSQTPEISSPDPERRASDFFSGVATALADLADGICKNLRYFFLPALLLGFYHCFTRSSTTTDPEKIILPAFILFNIIIMALLHYYYGYISTRHCLPLVVFTSFYIPTGLRIIADWLNSRFPGLLRYGRWNSDRWALVLLVLGIAVCMPKLLSPLRSDKLGYRHAAKWLNENTGSGDIIATPDVRITLYAERKAFPYEKQTYPPPSAATYLVTIVKGSNEQPPSVPGLEMRAWFWSEKNCHKKKIIIHQQKQSQQEPSASS
ncbi:MAG: glycosyltransferase family 39 protein [Planctomycetota bacterium]